MFLARLLGAMVEMHAEGEARAVLLSHEVNHRANNLLGVVQSISAQTARSAGSLEDYQALFTGRLMALARSHELLSETAAAEPDLRSFLTQIIEPFGAARFELDGPPAAAPRRLGQGCALLLHELSTNATKHGALSTPAGRVEIRWTLEGEGVRLDWREIGGPTVGAPTRAGFGSRLLKTAFPPDYGQVSLDFHPDGVRCAIRLNHL